MNKFTLFKCSALFLITFALGFGAAETAGNFEIQENGFTRNEAESHLYKRVQSLNSCNAKSVDVKDTDGRTVFIDKHDGDNGYSVAIDWDYSIRGRHEIFLYDKTTFEKCIIEVGESEQ